MQATERFGQNTDQFLRMDDESENWIRDYSSAYHGIPRNFNASRVKGMIGYAVSLDGIDDYIELPNQAYFEKGTDKLNLSFWEKHEYNDLDNFTIFHAHSSLGTLLQVQLPSAQGNLNLLTGSGSLDQTTTINTSIPQNNWNYWVLQSDLSTGISEIFLNGELEEEYFGITKPFDSFAETFRIGTNYDYSES